MPDPVAVNSMFGRIARRYDIANLLLSGGIDSLWRRRLVHEVKSVGPHDLLDLATGSGDVAFALSRNLTKTTQIMGMDFCQPMLERAEAKKAAAAGLRYDNIRFKQGDGLALPLRDEVFDVVTIAFGLRNLADRRVGLSEMRRVLRPEGSLFVLEFSQPARWVRPLYYFYLRHILPRAAGWVTGDRGAYEYLNNTISEFPDRAGLSGEIAQAGFSSVRSIPLTFGVVAIHHATR